MNLKNEILTRLIAILIFAGGFTTVHSQTDDTQKNVKVKTDSIKAPEESSVIDEVVWVVGDEAILKSDIENTRLQSEAEGVKWDGDPDCVIPEQLAVQKLFLHQAELDSIEVSEADVVQSVERQVSHWLQMVDGNKERLEEYKHKTLTELRNSLHDDFRNRLLIEKEQEKLVQNITVTPADVRKYFSTQPVDSLPVVPTEVEVQIITSTPKVEQAETDRIKDALRDYTDRIVNGQTSFAALASLYSEDPGTARQGGDLGDYVGRGTLDPSFANVAFNLTDPKKISKIVETEFGYHIIQLIDKRGDKIRVRHILRRPKVSTASVDAASQRLDSIANNIRVGKFTFDNAASYLSDDKDTRNNNGLMSNMTETGQTSRFDMRSLPSEVARVVDTLKVGEISAPFKMINEKNGKTVCAIIKLKNRIDTHRATITEDFQVMKNIVLNKRKEEHIKNWIKAKIKKTYVRINDRYKNCNFEYQGWIR